MRLYEFVQNDIDTCEFLMSIFTVSNWYVNNVYTYQGGNKNVSTIEYNAKAYASTKAYNRWKNYKENFFSNVELDDNKKILPVVYDDQNNPTNLTLYKCDLFKNIPVKSKGHIISSYDGTYIEKGFKNNYVVDDCSKFATAVYYHYFNDVMTKNKINKNENGFGIDLWTTGSRAFYGSDHKMGELLVNSGKFECIKYNEIFDKNNFKLKPGDLLYSNANKKTKMGHVEFYIGNNKVVSWGKINKNYYIYKTFTNAENGIVDGSDSKSANTYISIIRFKGR